jgi:hypothetical protein
MIIIFFVFTIVAIYVAFRAYRVFKAKDLGLLEGHLNIGGPQGQAVNRQRDEENDYQPAYLPPNQQQPNQNANY